MIKMAKKTWIDENCFYNRFEHIWFKSVFDIENYEFWKCGFNKICSCLCDRRHECIIYMISSQFVVKIYLYLKCNVK